jgi:hypothetical protein
MTSIAEVASGRGIGEILHFTTNKGLTGILAEGAVLSRKRLPQSKYLEHVYTPNAPVRKDTDWLDYVNLSISRINTEYFGHSSRWHANQEVWWCALAFDPAILSDEGVFFANTNNIYSKCQRGPGSAGLEALFAKRIERWLGKVATRETDMPENFTTCDQAEVLYPGKLALDRLLRVYVATGPHADIASATCEVLMAPNDEAAGPENKIPIVIDANVFGS